MSVPKSTLPVWESVLLTAVFVLFTLTPAIGWLAGAESGASSLQNRSLKEWPEPTARLLWSARWGDRFEAWFLDHVPFRADLLALDHHIDLQLLGDSPVPEQVVFGTNSFEWVVERIYEERSGPYRPPVSEVIGGMRRLDALADELGVPVAFVVSPNKALLYPEYLPPLHRPWYDAHIVPAMQALADYAAEPGSPLIDVVPGMRAEKARLLEDPTITDPRLRYLFRPTDRHWNLETGRLQARLLLEAMDGVEWTEQAGVVLAADYEERESEISEVYLKVGATEPYTRQVDNPFVELDQKNLRISKDRLVYSFRSTPTATFTPDPRTLLVVRDSFLNDGARGPSNREGGGIQSIAAHFQRSYFVHRRSVGEEDEGVEDYAREADLLLFQCVQGELRYFVSHVEQYAQLIRWVAEGRARSEEVPGSAPPRPASPRPTPAAD